MKTISLRLCALSCLVIAVLMAVPAAAQTVADQQSSPGPMTIVPVHNSFVLEPDVRFGRVNHRDATLPGATVGVLLDDRLLLGGGGYWIANNGRGFEMGYVGAVAGWYFRGEGPVALRLSALVGGGWSTMTWTGSIVPLGLDRHMRDLYPLPPGYSGVRTWLVNNDFFVAEPEANLCFRLARNFWLNAGVSYRYIGGADVFDRELRGATGTVSIVFGSR